MAFGDGAAAPGDGSCPRTWGGSRAGGATAVKTAEARLPWPCKIHDEEGVSIMGTQREPGCKRSRGHLPTRHPPVHRVTGTEGRPPQLPPPRGGDPSPSLAHCDPPRRCRGSHCSGCETRSQRARPSRGQLHAHWPGLETSELLRWGLLAWGGRCCPGPTGSGRPPGTTCPPQGPLRLRSPEVGPPCRGRGVPVRNYFWKDPAQRKECPPTPGRPVGLRQKAAQPRVS